MIGYNYLGGHTNSPWPQLMGAFATWVSPQTLNEDSSLPLVTDMNDWSPGYRKSFAPHGARGPILRAGDFSNSAANGASPKDIGGVGGNVGLLDGSVNWKRIAQMKVLSRLAFVGHRRLPGAMVTGCTAPTLEAAWLPSSPLERRHAWLSNPRSPSP